RVARTEADHRRRRSQDVARWRNRTRVHARLDARSRPQRRSAEPGSDSCQQPCSAATGRRKDWTVGEDRHNQLLQRLRGEPQMTLVTWRVRGLAILTVAFLLAPAFNAAAQSPNTSTIVVLVTD